MHKEVCIYTHSTFFSRITLVWQNLSPADKRIYLHKLFPQFGVYVDHMSVEALSLVEFMYYEQVFAFSCAVPQGIFYYYYSYLFL